MNTNRVQYKSLEYKRRGRGKLQRLRKTVAGRNWGLEPEQAAWPKPWYYGWR